MISVDEYDVHMIMSTDNDWNAAVFLRVDRIGSKWWLLSELDTIGHVEVLEIQIYKLKLINITFITGTKTYLVVNYSRLVWLQLPRS